MSCDWSPQVCIVWLIATFGLQIDRSCLLPHVSVLPISPGTILQLTGLRYGLRPACVSSPWNHATSVWMGRISQLEVCLPCDRERLFSALSGDILRVRVRAFWVGPAQVRLLLQFFVFLLFIFLFWKKFKTAINKFKIWTNFKLEQL
jgi:hypothetical protein